MATMTIDIVIMPDGKVQADVVGGHQGPACVATLGKLVEALGQPSTGHLKPEYELDEEAQALMRQLGVMA